MEVLGDFGTLTFFGRTNLDKEVRKARKEPRGFTKGRVPYFIAPLWVKDIQGSGTLSTFFKL